MTGVRVSNPAWRKYMRPEDVWENPSELEKHQVSAERLRPGDGSDSPVRGQDRRRDVRGSVDAGTLDLRGSGRRSEEADEGSAG